MAAYAITDDYRVNCKNPTCLGEPWCSAWGICKGHLQPEPEQAAEMQEASALEQEYDKLEQEYDKLFQELSQQESSTPLEWED